MFDSVNDSCGPDLDLGGPGLCGADFDGMDCDVSTFCFTGDIDVCGAEVLSESGGDLNSVDYGDGDGSYDGNPMGSMSKIDLDDPMVVAVHVIGHSRVDIKESLRQSAKDLGLVRIPWIRVGGRDLSKHYDQLMPLKTWLGKADRDEMSAGHYCGATGTTDVRRQYYCVGVHGISFLPFGELQWDNNAKAFIEVTYITWKYSQTGDYETRVLIKVIARLEYRARQAGYHRDVSPVVCNNKKALEFKKKLFAVLRRATPDWRTRQSRRAAVQGIHNGSRQVMVEDGAAEQICADLREDRPYGMGAVMMPV